MSKKTGAVNGEHLVRLKIKPVEGGLYVATSPDLPGLVAQGRSIAETMEIARDVARKLIDSYIEHADPLPRLPRSTSRGVEAFVAVAVSR